MSEQEPDFPTSWGEYKGRPRVPCPEDPVQLSGMPIGMYHCPYCGDMQIGGMPHLFPSATYELEYGCDWPPGYEEVPHEE